MINGGASAVVVDRVAWARRLQSSADLKAAMHELKGDRSSFGHAMRAKVNLVQALCMQANMDLRIAVVKAMEERAPDERILTISAYRRELGICRGRRTKEGCVPVETNFRDRPEHLRGILRYHRAIDGAQFLIDGSPGHAAHVYDELLASSSGDSNEAIACWLLGSASAATELGDQAGALRALDAAGLAVRHSEFLLFQARGAARLEATYRGLGLRAEAAEWGAYLDKLPCPDETRTAVRNRARLLRSYTRTSAPVM